MSLERALELAADAHGRASPKPTVGAVVVAADGQVVGEGATETDGRHGEIVALEAAGERARGATLYVTMEPCAHHGTTPPCADAVLAAGIARVVAGSLDPNPAAVTWAQRAGPTVAAVVRPTPTPAGGGSPTMRATRPAGGPHA